MNAPPARRPRPRIALLGGLALGFALAACGTDAGAGSGRPAGGTALQGSWLLVDGRDVAGAFPRLRAVDVTLDVDGDQVSGRSACNLYGTTVTVTGDSVTFGPAGGTEMACEPAVMDLERRYLAALTTSERAVRDEDALTLSGPDTVLEFAVVSPAPQADLVGTTWLLESLLAGDTASSAVSSAVSSAGSGGRLALGDDGTLAAETGCGEVRGSYRLSGGNVEVSDVTARSAAISPCTGPAESQHEHMVDVLGDDFAVRVDGDRLTVTSPTGRGLEFRAG